MFEIINEFRRYLINKERSMKTVKSYVINVNKMLKYFMDNNVIMNTNIDSIKSILLVDYNKYFELLSEKGNKASTKNQIISSIRAFYQFMIDRGLINDKDNITGKIEKYKLPERLPKFLTLKEASNLLNAPLCSDKARYCNKARDQAIIIMFLTTGLRLSELSSLNVNDIKNDAVRIIGKENKERTVYINEQTKEYLNKWLANRHNVESNALFISTHGNRLSKNRLETMIKGYLKQIGKGDLHLHNLRHTCFTNMANNNVPINVIQQSAGWASIQPAQIYLHATDNQVKNAMNKLKY